MRGMCVIRGIDQRVGGQRRWLEGGGGRWMVRVHYVFLFWWIACVAKMHCGACSQLARIAAVFRPKWLKMLKKKLAYGKLESRNVHFFAVYQGRKL